MADDKTQGDSGRQLQELMPRELQEINGEFGAQSLNSNLKNTEPLDPLFDDGKPADPVEDFDKPAGFNRTGEGKAVDIRENGRSALGAVNAEIGGNLSELDAVSMPAGHSEGSSGPGQAAQVAATPADRPSPSLVEATQTSGDPVLPFPAAEKPVANPAAAAPDILDVAGGGKASARDVSDLGGFTVTSNLEEASLRPRRNPVVQTVEPVNPSLTLALDVYDAELPKVGQYRARMAAQAALKAAESAAQTKGETLDLSSDALNAVIKNYNAQLKEGLAMQDARRIAEGTLGAAEAKALEDRALASQVAELHAAHDDLAKLRETKGSSMGRADIAQADARVNELAAKVLKAADKDGNGITQDEYARAVSGLYAERYVPESLRDRFDAIRSQLDEIQTAGNIKQAQMPEDGIIRPAVNVELPAQLAGKRAGPTP